MARSKITIRDVAAQAGVSRQTVSRVINGSERVLAETRLRVEKAIAELDYQPNAIARSMARGRTGLLACIAPNVTDYTFSSIIEGAQTEARQYGHFLLSTTAPDGETFDSLMDQLVNSGRTDGLIIIQPYIEDRSQGVPAGCPVVFAGGGAHADQEIGSSVVLDDAAAAYAATRHLLDLGHRRLGMITGPLDEICVQNRMIGFEKGLEEAGLEPAAELIIEGDWSAISGYNALRQLWETADPPPTALFVQNDLMAAGALRFAAERQLSIPRELSIIGIDDIPLAAYLAPPLTTMRQDFREIGRQAAHILIRSIEQDVRTPQHVQLQATLIRRHSTGRP